MKRVIHIVMAVIAISALVPSLATAAEKGIVINKPWIREAPPNVQVLAAYMVIDNRSDKERTLTGAASPAFSKVEIHETVMHQGMAMMHEKKDLKIPAKGSVTLKPGGYHLMLIGPLVSNRIAAGMTIPVSLSFANGENRVVNAMVMRGNGNMNQGNHMHHGHHMNH